MALNTKQLLYLNVLMNADGLCRDGFGENVGELARRLLPGAQGKERTILENILADDHLSGMAILHPACEAWGAGYCAFADGREELVVAFRGTTTGAEWYDNFIAANQADGAHQTAALQYLEGLELSDYDTVTVTGHSKGGNKAMYCAAVSGHVDRCVSFDGQGFSDAFMEKYAYRVAERWNRIENHCAGGDYINILLNGIGERFYYQTYNPSGNFFLNHELTAMCDDAGEMRPSAQEPEIGKLKEFMDAFFHSLSGERMEEVLDLLGRAFALILKGDTATAGASDLLSLLTQSQHRRALTEICAFFIRYERQSGGLTDAIREIVDGSGLNVQLRGLADRFLDLLAWQAKNPLAIWGIASGINALVENREWSALLGAVSEAAWRSNQIRIR